MSTLVIQIGNTDNKLTQKEWAWFCEAVKDTIRKAGFAVHFYGNSPGDALWQNAAWVVDGDPQSAREEFANDLRRIALAFRQDSIAVTVGETKFLKP